MIRKASIRFALGHLLMLVVWLFVTGDGWTAAAHEPASAAAQEGNLLKNPGFERRFRAWNGIPEIQVAPNWTPWWWEDPNHVPAYFRPEYKRALASAFPKRVFSGESAQQWFTFHASHVAGMYQQVFDVTPGQRYRFSIWAQVWSSTEDNPNQSVMPANPHLQIGIDPTGNWNAGAPTVNWSAEAPMSGVIDQWGLMVLEATAENNIITVFMRTSPDFANKHNDMYWDNASLEAVQTPPPTSPPSATTSPATKTLEATAPPAATYTPPAASTSIAMATATATATDSPTFTTTPTAVPPTATRTATHAVTNTATATPTTLPTDTLRSTATTIATATQATLPASSPYDASEGQQATATDRHSATNQQSDEGDIDGDDWGVFALAAILIAVGLLVVLILVVARGLGHKAS